MNRVSQPTDHAISREEDAKVWPPDSSEWPGCPHREEPGSA